MPRIHPLISPMSLRSMGPLLLALRNNYFFLATTWNTRGNEIVVSERCA